MLRYKDGHLEVEIPEENFLYFIKPEEIPGLRDEKSAIENSLKEPIGCSALFDQVKKGMKVVIIGDDITRPTPRERIFPVILDSLNRAGVPDKDITAIISLGTHRYMTDEEIERCFGKEVVERISVINHEWKEESNLVRVGTTPTGVPVSVNKIAYEADYLIAVGSIVPHCLAGYGGGGKAVQPGISSWETTGKTHLLPMEKDMFLNLVGDVENEVRLEMEKVAELVGLKFIVNVVLNEKREIVFVASGDQVKAFREGVKVARKVYERRIPSLADVVVVSAYPADIDYWQGLKPLSYAQKGLKKGGTAILVASFPDGISPTHSELGEYATHSYGEIKKMVKENRFDDLVCASTLLQHVRLMEYVGEVICVSEGLSPEDKEKLGFKHAESVGEALEIALRRQGKGAKVGVIDYGGDVLPRI
ncbi:nickel-dependent lactate racemase [Candidatus Aerophobetes bacterium]|nr:nickel-dependent lactate racemase [Candidatus Aerophobetes bacterium]